MTFLGDTYIVFVVFATSVGAKVEVISAVDSSVAPREAHQDDGGEEREMLQQKHHHKHVIQTRRRKALWREITSTNKKPNSFELKKKSKIIGLEESRYVSVSDQSTFQKEEKIK